MEKDLTRVSKLVVFDFDGTLIRSPLPDTGKDIWLEKTGNEWPHTGWWSKVESLDMDVFDIPLIEETIGHYHLGKDDETVGMIVLTGRLPFLSSNVKKILESNNLIFDGYFFNTGGKTDLVKIKTLNELLETYPNIVSIEMFEDRDEHIEVFNKWGQELVISNRLIGFNINHIK
jgi:hypothetical protein